MPLSDLEVRRTPAGARDLKLFDGHGLYLLVKASGSRLWRLKYRIAGHEKLLALGSYPEVSLKCARERRNEARRLLASGIDPGAARRAERTQRSDTFEALAREWLGVQAQGGLAARTLTKKAERFEAFVFPYLGARPIAEIRGPEVLAVLKRIEVRGKLETAHRVRSECGNVFRYAVASGRAERDPSGDLRGALAPVVTRNRPAILEPARIGELMRAIYGYRGDRSSEFALKLLPLTFVRPGELRAAEWREIDLEAAEWRIPAARMKMREQHIVPLATQTLALLQELKPLAVSSRYVFPSVRSPERCISNNTVNAALRRMGFSGDEMVAHGFRSMASTCLNEQGWPPDVIELQLAHAERNEVRSAYNRAQRLAERREMMQAWADYLDALRTGANVVPFRRSA